MQCTQFRAVRLLPGVRRQGREIQTVFPHQHFVGRRGCYAHIVAGFAQSGTQGHIGPDVTVRANGNYSYAHNVLTITIVPLRHAAVSL